MKQAISQLILKTLGWKIIGSFPKDLKKAIVIVAPHTSSWDFPLSMIGRSALGKRIQFFGKDSLFKPPFGFIFRWFGGIPVDRSHKNGFVSSSAAIIKKKENVFIGISPEGTRKKANKLRTGFWYIAKEAEVPIVCVGYDFPRKQIRILEVFHPSDDIEKDLPYLKDMFKDIKGYHPELGLN